MQRLDREGSESFRKNKLWQCWVLQGKLGSGRRGDGRGRLFRSVNIGGMGFKSVDWQLAYKVYQLNEKG